MSNPSRISQRVWLAFPIGALALLLVSGFFGARRIDYVSEVAGRPAGAAPGPWQPRLIVPGHHNESYEWLDQSRQMLSRGEWRVRHIDYENAQAGRDVLAPSPYRWYLGVLALAHHAFTGNPAGESLEWAAVYADPLLLFLAGTITALAVARRRGLPAGCLVGAGMGVLYPFAAEFIPGVPDDAGLALLLALWSILPVLEGASVGGPGARRLFAAGGVIGGLGLWVSVSREMPVLAGIGLGGLVAAWASRARPAPEREALPWLTWSLAGAVTCLAAYLVEYFPSNMGAWEFHVNHPLFGVEWLGLGGLVVLGAGALQGAPGPRGVRGIAAWVLAALAAASLPVAMRLTHGLAFLSTDLSSMRLTLEPATAGAPSLWAWLLQNGFTLRVWATLLPLLVLGPAIGLLFTRAAPEKVRIPVAVALGPVLVALGFAFRQINAWNGVDAALLALVAASAGAYGLAGWPAWVATVSAALAGFALFLPGAVHTGSRINFHASEGLTETEAVGLVERDLSNWLQRHVGSAGAVALAPPNMTSTLHYYAGIKGLGNFGWENREGLQAAVRIVSASTPEEAQELIGSHGVTHIVIPLWDPYMDAFAQIGEGQLEGTFLARLYKWNLPPWLRPVSYPLPGIAGFENQSVIILEVVDEQDDASALSNIAVYLSEMGQIDLATKAAGALRRFPGDFGALVARTQVDNAAGQTDDFASNIDTIVRRLKSGADRQLTWDRRIGLAVVLAQGHHMDLSREVLAKCLGDVDAAKLRSLSTNSLFRLHILDRAFGTRIADPELHALSLDLLPSDLRSRVE